ncbi:MAG: hypothetical protein Q8L89_00965 [Gammaproteobacteria bacterium]|nr:hypothetical protein [Gammaproteobacteria bacterium]
MPNRILREGILASERVAMLSWAEEVFYRRIMSVVDDFGRYHANPKLLRAACYPLLIDKVSDADTGKWLTSCVTAALVSVYLAPDGKRYLQLLDFRQQTRAEKSKYPPPPEGCTAATTHVSSICVADAHLDGDGDGDVEDLAQPAACADTSRVPRAPTVRGDGFPAFWRVYPKKRSKGDAEKAWKTLKPDKALQTTIITAVEHAKKSKDWVKDGGEFIPYPAKWLRGKGWEDIDLVAVAAQSSNRRSCCWIDDHGVSCAATSVGHVSGKGYCQNKAHQDFAFYGEK